MCGIAGYYIKSHSVSPNWINRMTDGLKHRGPDASGVYFHGHVALGHRRLSILDLSSEANQPMTSHCGRYTMVYNGEVYNFKEIANDLQLKLRTTSDSEVVLESFVKLGSSFVNRLNGMFAIAIYDKVEEKLYLFRDQMGIKPLYYYCDEGAFIFASELKVIEPFQSILGEFEIDSHAVYAYLSLGFIPQPRSIYSKISKLSAGNWLSLDADGICKVHKYWSLIDSYTPETIDDPAKVKKVLKEKLISSVESRLVSDVKVGTFLSGGIDSSLITAIASQCIGKNLDSFSIGFHDSQHDETPYAEKVARYLGTNHHAFILTEQDALDYLPQFFETSDEPFADSSVLPTMAVSKLARENVTVALSGDGADELFFGYGRIIRAKFYSQNILKILRGPLANMMDHIPDHRFKKASIVFNGYPNGYFNTHITSQESNQFSTRELEQLLLQPHNGCGFFFDEQKPSVRSLTPREDSSLYNLRYYLVDDILTKVDRSSMLFGLEARVPFLDHEFVTYALNISPKFKFNNGVSKSILKEILYEYVPKNYFERPKQGFTIPLNNWLKNKLRPYLEYYLKTEIIEDVGILCPEYVSKITYNFLHGGKAYSHLGQRIWQLIVLQKWMVDRKKYVRE